MHFVIVSNTIGAAIPPTRKVPKPNCAMHRLDAPCLLMGDSDHRFIYHHASLRGVSLSLGAERSRQLQLWMKVHIFCFRLLPSFV
jgi:hypothetical protein